MERRLSILINAYACSPDMGSEPGMAWNWCVNLARHCELYIITESEFRHNIEDALQRLPQGRNMHFYYNPVTDRVRRMCWNQGDWRFYYYYRKWQKKTLVMAKDIIAGHRIDIVHQLNMIGFREPGYLWRLDKPFVWGPVNAKKSFPVAYLAGAGMKKRVFIYVKNTLNILQLKFSRRVRRAAGRAVAVIAASSDSMRSIEEYFNCRTVLINETGCYCETSGENGTTDYGGRGDDTFDILWVGRFIFSKKLDLALKVLAATGRPEIRLHIVGGTPREEAGYKTLASLLGVDSQCVWHHKIARHEVGRMMRRCRLLLFTSVAEGTPHVVLEAISNRLPVLCFDTCGQGDTVDGNVGMKIRPGRPEDSIAKFAEAVEYLRTHPEELRVMSENCAVRSRELSWDALTEAMLRVYGECMPRGVECRQRQ